MISRLRFYITEKLAYEKTLIRQPEPKTLFLIMSSVGLQNLHLTF